MCEYQWKNTLWGAAASKPFPQGLSVQKHLLPWTRPGASWGSAWQNKTQPPGNAEVSTRIYEAWVPHIPIGPGGPGRASLVWLNQVTSIAQGWGTAAVNGVYSPLDRHMSPPLASMGVTNAWRRKAPMCPTHIRKEQRGQFSPEVRACSSVMPCSSAEIQLSFNSAQWVCHQNTTANK